MIESRLVRYRKWAATCASTNYGTGDCVDRHNAAVDEMRRIVVEPGATDELSSLLDEPESARWLAIQLLETAHEEAGPDQQQQR